MEHPGNRRFREHVQSELSVYSATNSKTVKSAVIQRICKTIETANPSTGGFVKFDKSKKQWYAVDSKTARANTAQAFRDALYSRYRSSKQNKRARRRFSHSPPESVDPRTVSPWSDRSDGQLSGERPRGLLPQNNVKSSSSVNVNANINWESPLPLIDILGMVDDYSSLAFDTRNSNHQAYNGKSNSSKHDTNNDDVVVEYFDGPSFDDLWKDALVDSELLDVPHCYQNVQATIPLCGSSF